MKSAVAISVAVVVLVGGLLALDWYILGSGPLTSRAVNICTEAKAGDVQGYGTVSRIEARDLCEDAARRGALTIRGGISR